MASTHSRRILKKKLDLDEKAKEAGFRNFISFVFLYYYDQKFSPKSCAKVLGVSLSRFRQEVIDRKWPLRNYKQAPRPIPRKRKLYIKEKVAKYTKFSSPKEAVNVLYNEYGLTSYEAADVLHISQSSFLTLLKKFNYKRRKQGRSNN